MIALVLLSYFVLSASGTVFDSPDLEDFYDTGEGR